MAVRITFAGAATSAVAMRNVAVVAPDAMVITGRALAAGSLLASSASTGRDQREDHMKWLIELAPSTSH